MTAIGLDYDPLAEVCSRLTNVTPAGNNKRKARCPAHEDANPSLSIAVGDQNQVLLHCFTGCDQRDIVAAIGLEMRNLWPDCPPGMAHSTTNGNGRAHHHSNNGKPAKRDLGDVMARYQAALTEEEAERHAESRGATVAGLRAFGCGSNNGCLCWPEYDAEGTVTAIVTLCDDGVKRAGQGHARGVSMCADPVESDHPNLLVEGAGDAIACWIMNIPAIGRANNTHGGVILAKLFENPDADFIVVADRDDAGRTGAAKLAQELANRLNREVRWSECPPPHKDVRDFLKYCTSKDIAPATAGDLLTQHLEDNATIVEPETADEEPVAPAVDAEPEPFPLDALTPKIRSIVVNVAAAMGVDESVVALPILCLLSALIGNSRRLVIKRGWTVSAMLWGAIVGASGDGKTPPIEFAMRQLTRLYARAIKQYGADVQNFNAAMVEWNSKSKDERGPKPKEPILTRVLIEDITIEAVMCIHHENPRGLGMIADELSGFVSSFNQYKKSGADMATWLKVWSGLSITLDRKGGSGAPRQHVHLPYAYVSICGGLQPATMLRVFKEEHFENGLVPRFLFSMPTPRLRRWTEQEISEADEQTLEFICDRLYELQPGSDEAGQLKPVFLGMSMAAKAKFIAFFNAHCRELFSMRGNLRAAWTKKEGYVGRLALITHLSRWAAGEPINPDKVDETSVENAIKLARWFANEDRRVYAMLDEGVEGREARELVQLIEAKSPHRQATPRNLQQWNRRRYPSAEEAEMALTRLVKEGRGKWSTDRPKSGPGAPKRVFTLANCVRATPANGTALGVSE